MASEAELEIRRGLAFAPLPHTTRGQGFHLGATTKSRKGARMAYGNQNNVIIRNLENLNDSIFYAEHQARVTVAKFDKKNGGWMSTGDESGMVKVWSSSTQALKQDIMVGKCCTDIDWDGESQRLIMVGRGKDDKIKITPWNTSNKLGAISGVAGNCLSCAFKTGRPYKVAIAAEDPVVVISKKGPPFAFEFSDKTHKKYVNCVRFRPCNKGDFYITCSSDKKILVHDSKTGKMVREFDSKQGHKASVYAVEFNDDGTKVLSVGADKVAKMWDFESGQCEKTFTIADGKPGLNDMQVACAWEGQYMISISLNGQINFLSPDSDTPIKKVAGHKKTINACEIEEKEDLIYTGCADGFIVRTNMKTGDNAFFVGKGHEGKSIGFLGLSSDSKRVYSLGLDGTLLNNDAEKMTFAEKGIKLDGAPKSFATSNSDASLVAAGTHKNKIFMIKDGTEITSTIETASVPRSMQFSPDDSEIVVGCEDKKIYFFNMEGTQTGEISSDKIRNHVTTVKYSPDGTKVAMIDADRWIWIFKRDDLSAPINESYRFHGSAVNDLSWSPDGSRLVSAGLDSTIMVWLEAGTGGNKNIQLDFAHTTIISNVRFVDDNTIVSTGHDASIRMFQIAEKPPAKPF